MVVNGKGKVVNLYADRANSADNAAKLGGKTPAQIVASVPRPAGVIWVAKSGGQFTSVKAALASITDNGPAHPYVIMVGPGTFVETSTIVLKTFVDIEGSGRNRTTLFCDCHGSGFSGHATVSETTAIDAEVRDLTITNITNANGTYAIAMYVGAPYPAFSLVHVTLTALDSGYLGHAIGLKVDSGAVGPHLDDLNVYVVDSPDINEGIVLSAPTIVRNSWIVVAGTSVAAYSGSALIASTVVGTTSGFAGRCTAVFSDTGAPVTCT
jgi:hypothetical protein